MLRKGVLIAGLFPDTEHKPVTQAAELARLLKANDYEVYAVSRYSNKLYRLFDIIYSLWKYRRRYDAVIVQFYSGNSFIWQYLAAKMAKAFRKKLVFTIHGGGVPDRIKRHPGRYLSILKTADTITCPSSYMQQVLETHSIPSILIENTIALGNYPFAEKNNFKPVILWMRAYSYIYNPEMAIRVIAALKKDYPAVKMYMCGPDLGLQHEIRELVSSFMLDENVVLKGFINFEEKKALAAECDIYISTNRIDNTPVTVTEMWAMGLPVISTNVGGVPFLVQDNVNGLLVNDNDHVAMARAIKQLIENPSLAAELVKNGRESVKAYDEQVVYKKWDNLLLAL